MHSQTSLIKRNLKLATIQNLSPFSPQCYPNVLGCTTHRPQWAFVFQPMANWWQNAVKPSLPSPLALHGVSLQLSELPRGRADIPSSWTWAGLWLASTNDSGIRGVLGRWFRAVSACSTSMGTWVWILGTHAKSRTITTLESGHRKGQIQRDLRQKWQKAQSSRFFFSCELFVCLFACF